MQVQIPKKLLQSLILSLLFTLAQGQDASYTIKFAPPEITMEVGESVQISAEVYDSNGDKLLNRQVRFFSRKAKAAYIDSTNTVHALLPGEYSIIAISPDPQGNRARGDLKVKINYPPITALKIIKVPEKIYAGTRVAIRAKAIDKAGLDRPDVKIRFATLDSSVATVDGFGNITAIKPGKTSIKASYEDITTQVNISISLNPVKTLELVSAVEEARTGDVVQFDARAIDGGGKTVEDIPIIFTFQGEAVDISSSASGLIHQDGRFVADEPGLYTITASCGAFSAYKTVKVQKRDVQRKIELVGRGSVNTKHTSDFWVWEGIDGRDYAVTGTWGADGTAYFWDVTRPANLFLIDSIKVDARTVNDVKVSEDGRICVISREGASNRKNGIVILDVANPRDVKIISTFTENLTGGVHNLFIYQNHVYALSAGRKYYVINIENPVRPQIVGSFELDSPGRAIHDVWVENGIAYSSNWSDGVQLVDVGNGIAGGSPRNPVKFASYAYPSGAHHATFPFKSKSSGKFYVLLGDEIFPYGLNLNGENIAGGFIHVVDFTDLENPKEVARFEVPGAGSHNFWIEDEILYVAFYNGGVRVVDISGELMGDLYKQGREMAWIIPGDPQGYIPNAPFTWGAQPYKGHIFYSDWNSGLWAARLEPVKMQETKIETK